ncbi:PAS domain-containing protein [Nannocystis bainbridge]|uniref:PAS domain-containing protein n=1 Tax=Nannocystis bainbridge TaxID=2995303 RepID=A0ABT5DQH7_9BACT|nr:PAS domain-containing protein [Nannocystis bainbridge]MDC0715400.1 PAS domain-containing protein [Nannocystis bainbridge]
MERRAGRHRVPFVVVGFDLELRIDEWNESAEQLLGVARDEAVGRVVAELAPTRGGDWRAVLEDSYAGPLRTTLTDGRVFEWSPAPVHDEAGTRVGVVCYGREVTAAVAAEKRVQIEQAALRAFLSHLPTVVSVFDREGTYLLVEGKGLESVGIAPNQFVGQNAFALYGNAASAEFIRRGLAGEIMPMTALEEFGKIWENWHIPVLPGSDAGLVTISLEVTATRARERELLEKLELIERQQRVIHELSTPIIEVWEGVLALPIIGLVDSVRTAEIMDSLLQHVARMRARHAILDMTGIEVVDTSTANHLIGMIRAIRLLGAEGVITGINPNIAQTIVTLGVDMRGIHVFATLREALKHCIGAARGLTRAGPRGEGAAGR